MILGIIFFAKYFRPRLAKKSFTCVPWEQIKNASDRMFVTIAFGSDDTLHVIWDILYFYSLGASYTINN